MARIPIMFESSDSQDEKWMRQALALAQRARDLGEVPVGAVLVRDDQLIAEAWNQPISTCDPTAHAEVSALRQGGLAVNNYRLCDTTMYVTLEPCVMCYGAMVHARIARLVFGAHDPKSGVVTTRAKLPESDIFNHKITWTGGVLEAECGGLLTEFFRARRGSKA